MRIDQARDSEAADIAAVLREAAHWLIDSGRALWAPAEFAPERISPDVAAGRYFGAREGEHLVGVMRVDLDDSYFWPEIAPGTSAFVHKLAVRRAWAKRGVSTELLSFARTHARDLGRPFLRLDCVADRADLRTLYENFGFRLHSVVQRGTLSFARYEISTET
jgi:GNAT superfamily N-acetyltransferase